MKDTIRHQGRVERIDGRHISVRIVQTSACATCVAKGHCNASESKIKIIDIYDADSSAFQVGQEVDVEGSTSMGMQAVLWAFGVPFVVMFGMLFVLMRITGGDEMLSAAGALGALLPYYLIIYMLRDKLREKFSFTIKPINN